MALSAFNPPSTAERVRGYLLDLQSRITGAVEAIEGPRGARFLVDPWRKSPDEPLQGDGVTQILEGGRVFERAGVGFSHVRGAKLPSSATQHRPELAGAPFEAMGVSLVFHPLNPYVPTVHMNVRMISAGQPGQEPVCWFGGGMDLTPYYGFEEDAVHFHRICHDTLKPFGEGCTCASSAGATNTSTSSTATSSVAWAASSLMTSPPWASSAAWR